MNFKANCINRGGAAEKIFPKFASSVRTRRRDTTACLVAISLNYAWVLSLQPKWHAS
jgi:hypothetical protein